MVPRAAALCSICLVSPSFGQTRNTVRLAYSRGPGAESCPEERALRDAVLDLLGYDPFRADAKEDIDARVVRGPGGLEAAIDLLDESGRSRGVRRLLSRRQDCAQLASALALALAIAVDPLMADRVSAGLEPAPLPADRPAPVAKQSQPPPDRVAPTVRRLGFLAHGTLGAAPGPAPGFDLIADLRRGRFSVSIDARVDLPASKDVPGGTISGWLATGSLVGCVHHHFVAGCALLGAGALRVDGHDLENARGATEPLAVAGARAALEIPLSQSLAAMVHADLYGTLIETAVLVGGQEAWKTPPVSGAAGAGLLAVFP
jgi:hypothetical protein